MSGRKRTSGDGSINISADSVTVAGDIVHGSKNDQVQADTRPTFTRGRAYRFPIRPSKLVVAAGIPLAFAFATTILSGLADIGGAISFVNDIVPEGFRLIAWGIILTLLAMCALVGAFGVSAAVKNRITEWPIPGLFSEVGDDGYAYFYGVHAECPNCREGRRMVFMKHHDGNGVFGFRCPVTDYHAVPFDPYTDLPNFDPTASGGAKS